MRQWITVIIKRISKIKYTFHIKRIKQWNFESLLEDKRFISKDLILRIDEYGCHMENFVKIFYISIT